MLPSKEAKTLSQPEETSQPPSNKRKVQKQWDQLEQIQSMREMQQCQLREEVIEKEPREKAPEKSNTGRGNTQSIQTNRLNPLRITIVTSD